MTYRYAARGCPVIVSGRNEQALKIVVKRCAEEFGNLDVHYFIADATIEEHNKALVDFAIEKFGRLDIVVLAAGVSAHVKFEDLPDLDIFRKIIDTNLFGYVNLTRHTLPFLKQTRGQYVVISSL